MDTLLLSQDAQLWLWWLALPAAFLIVALYYICRQHRQPTVSQSVHIVSVISFRTSDLIP